MIRDITIGQYYPADSVIHALDPRTKVIMSFVFIFSLFLTSDIKVYLGIALLFGLLCKASKIPLSFVLRGLKAVFFIIGITVLFNLFQAPGKEVWFEWSFLRITKEGVFSAVAMAMRLILLIIGSSFLTLTTQPVALTDAIESLLKPFEVIKVPAHEIAMMMSIALRFIPILLEETDKIMKAQLARGASFEQKGLIKKTKAMLPLLVPLFLSAFRRADDLALAMEARCYRGGKGRTKFKPLKYQTKDYIAYGLMLSYLGLIIFITWGLPHIIGN